MSRLADVYPMSFAAVQKHVAVLERAGLVTKERRGREQLVRTDGDAVGRARRVLDELETAWRGRVDRMADLLAQVAADEHRQRREGLRQPQPHLVAEFDAPIERVWQLWADPRQLERWWGPPTHPATVEKHDLAAGGEVAYFMTGPEGEQSRGWWRVTSVDPPQVARVHRRIRQPGRDAERRHADHRGAGAAHRARRRHPHGAALRLRVQRAHGAAERWGAFEVFPQSVGQMDALLDDQQPAQEAL